MQSNPDRRRMGRGERRPGRALTLRRTRDRPRARVRRQAGGSRGRGGRSRCTARARCRRGSAPRSSIAPRSCSASGTRSSPAPSPRKRPSRSRPLASRHGGRCRRSRSPPRLARTAHRRDGAHGRVRRRRGQARVHPAGADRRRRGDQPVQLPAEPRGPQGRTGDRRRLPDGAEAGVADAAVGDRARPPADRRSAGSRPGTSTSSPGAGRTSATRWSTTTTSP